MQPHALLSVFDKSGIIEFARALVDKHNYRLISSGGTYRKLQEAALPVTEVSEYTGFPEMMDGRVKTLHPRIHGGLLAARHEIELIDLVVVNLYPFEETIAKPGVTRHEAIEMIDIGGPSMLRSAAKNAASVTVICDPTDYIRVLEAMDGQNKLDSLRRELALKVFQHTSAYDATIAGYLESEAEQPDIDGLSGLPKTYTLKGEQAMRMRYGENPHQQAALYGRFFECYQQLQGKELSYNNLLDITAATYLIGEFKAPSLAILKHTNPCGVASHENLSNAWDLAFETDKQAPFGGIIVVNQTVDQELAERIAEIFCEIIIAPNFSDESLAIFSIKKNLRLMVAKSALGPEALRDVHSCVGGFLVQDRDQKKADPTTWKVVTERQPTEEEWASMVFGWRVVKHVKSNAIIYTRNERTLGIGAGQMSRVDSSRIAVWKAGEAGLSLDGSSLCSDALIPFADGLIAAADAGATSCVQTGGSKRDDEVIAAANERGMAMVFTGVRHFRH